MTETSTGRARPRTTCAIRWPARVLSAMLVLLSACAEAPTAIPGDPAVGASMIRGGAIGSMDGPAPSRAAAQFEVKFMTDMIDHHQMAIMMSQLCIAKAVHAELRALCTEIIAAQQAETAQMRAWLQAWYGIAYQPQMKPGDMRQMEKMAALAPSAFEIAFMEMMIRHHEKAIKEGRHCLERASHAELRALCEDIIETQSREIALMQSWLCAWYGRCK